MKKQTAFYALPFALLAVSASWAAPIWPQWKYDMQLTGRSPYAGPDTAVLAWTYDVGDTFTIRYSAPVIGEDGTVYFPANDSFVYAVNPAGQEKWRYKTGGLPGLPAIDRRGRIFFGVNNYQLLALDDSATYAKLAWSWGPADTSYFSCSQAVVGPDRTVYITFDSMRAFDSTGAVKWSAHRGEYGAFPPAFSPDGQYMYYEYVPDAYNVTLLKSDLNGGVVWIRNIGGAPTCLTWGSPAVGADSTVYFGVADGHLLAIRPGNVDKWPPIGGLGFNLYMTASLGLGDTIWFMNRQKRPQYWIFAPNDGSEQFEDSITVTPSRYNYYNSFTTDVLGRAYIILRDSTGGSNLATLYAFNNDGTVKWTYPLPRPLLRAMPAISSDGTMYVVNGTKLYALRQPAAASERPGSAGPKTRALRIAPNPCPGRTSVSFDAGPGAAADEAVIYSILGRRVRKLDLPPGSGRGWSATWDGRDEMGRAAEAGVYFCRVTGRGFSATAKIILER